MARRRRSAGRVGPGLACAPSDWGPTSGARYARALCRAAQRRSADRSEGRGCGAAHRARALVAHQPARVSHDQPGSHRRRFGFLPWGGKAVARGDALAVPRATRPGRGAAQALCAYVRPRRSGRGDRDSGERAGVCARRPGLSGGMPVQPGWWNACPAWASHCASDTSTPGERIRQTSIGRSTCCIRRCGPRRRTISRWMACSPTSATPCTSGMT